MPPEGSNDLGDPYSIRINPRENRDVEGKILNWEVCGGLPQGERSGLMDLEHMESKGPLQTTVRRKRFFLPSSSSTRKIVTGS